MKMVSIQYFAILREQAGCAEENLRTAAETPRVLYAELATRHGFKLPQEAIKVAVNDDFSDWERRLAEHDRVVFIPPVAGG